MNDSLHIQQRLRTLLERFYDGSTSPEEEREINRLLSSAECQTEEFAADSRLFAALTAPTADTPPPPALGEKLEKWPPGISARTASHRRYGFDGVRPPPYFWGWLSHSLCDTPTPRPTRPRLRLPHRHSPRPSP